MDIESTGGAPAETILCAIGRANPFHQQFALVKPPWVILTTGKPAPATVSAAPWCVSRRTGEGAVNAEVIIELPGDKTVASIQTLGLKVGVRACALIKVSHIILAVAA